eukprot:TRINITY_DN4558_c0_g2_i1.p1 TRINITY_DN4558_c0_g2~~TRINITY_DN4558_c0_g2_i1.p1  ORF type:complete len:219 (+),score=64.19 TRINITY_DN4558_c0_g2_i1:59-715(+)
MSLGKLISHTGLPNSTPVEYYLKVRGLTEKYPVQSVNVMASDKNPTGEVRGELAEKLPGGAIPALELADGTIIEESNAIMEYFESAHPEGNLEGADPKKRALNRMWNDKIEKMITENALDSFRTGPGKDIFVQRFPCLEGAHETFSKRVDHFMAVVEKTIPEKGFLGGDKPNIADLRMVAVFEFMTNDAFGNVMRDNLTKNPKFAALFARQKEFLAAL